MADEIRKFAESSDFPCGNCGRPKMKLTGYDMVRFQGKAYLARTRRCKTCEGIQTTIQRYPGKADPETLPDIGSSSGFGFLAIKKVIRDKQKKEVSRATA